MSQLTDIVIAASTEARQVLDDEKHFETWPCLQLKGLDNQKLAALSGALDLPEFAGRLQGEDLLLCAGDGGPWVFLVPSEMRDRLSDVPPQRIPQLAKAWAAEEELQFDEWSAADVEPLIRSLKEFATKARSENKDLLLWMSL